MPHRKYDIAIYILFKMLSQLYYFHWLIYLDMYTFMYQMPFIDSNVLWQTFLWDINSE